MSSTALIVFARAPVAGAAKTRLIPRLGAAGAAQLQAQLTLHAVRTCRAAALGPVLLYCSPDTHHPFFQDCRKQTGVTLAAQLGPDLGARMHNALRDVLAIHERALLIGTDCPALTPAHLRYAAAALDEHEVAIIPAIDGGYVLIGARRVDRAMFDGVAWSTDRVMEQTAARLATLQWRWHALPALWDVDTPDDFERLEQEGLLNHATP